MLSLRRRKASRVCLYVVVTSLCMGAGAFFSSPPSSSRAAAAGRWSGWSPRQQPATTRLNGVREWKEGQPGDLREIGFLPFPVDDVMCPGETKALHLYEARFLSLFENAIRNHGGCVGGAIFVDDGVLVRVGQLCDIVAWEREEVGVSVALRCVGRCEITDVTNVDPYISATVREVRDLVGVDEPDEEGEGNDVVSSDVFSLHRQCVELESKMATAAGGNIGWEAGGGGGFGRVGSPSSPRISDEAWDQSGEDGGGGGGDELFDDSVSTAIGSEGGEAEGDDDLMARFQRGGGELDLSQLEGGGGGEGGQSPAAAAAAAGEAGEKAPATGGGGRGWSEGPVGGRGGGKIDYFEADEEDEEEEEEEEDEEEEEEGGREKGLGDLLWGHETYENDGFDSSLEDQVEQMYDSLKADLSVSLEETRGGADAVAFGARPGKNGNSGGGGGDRPWGTGVGPRTFTDMIAAATSAGAGGGGGGGGEEEGDGSFLWGCTSAKEEREQLVSFVSLGCFDPSARLQSLMLMSTGDRLRMARDALAERLKVLVAKSALSQLGD